MALYASRQVLEEYKDSSMRKVLNETYFGRTPGIMRCLDALSDFRSKYVGRGPINAVKHISADHDKDLHRFCREMEREFGLYSFTFKIKNDPSMNAYTYLIYFKADRNPKSNVVVSKNGYKFKEDIQMSIICCIYTGLLFDERFTDEQIMAVVLHEVGHNFQEYLNGSVHALTSVNGFAYVILTILQILQNPMSFGFKDIKSIALITDASHKSLSKWFNDITSEEDRNNIYSYWNFIKGIVNLPKQAVMSVLSVFLLPICKYYTGIMKIYGKFSLFGITFGASGYLGEVIADNFTSYYGFAEEQATALELMGNKAYGLADVVADIPVIGHIYNFVMLPGDLLISLGDEHPRNSARARNMLDSMKHDLNDPDLDPKLKKRLAQEIDQYKKTMDQIYSDKSRLSNARFVQGILDQGIFGGGSIRASWNNSIWGDPAKEADKANARLRESYEADSGTHLSNVELI